MKFFNLKFFFFITIILSCCYINLFSQAPILYGLTSRGADGSGSLYNYDCANSINSQLHIFEPQTKVGEYPNTGFQLIEASNGKLYGATVNGGSQNAGVIFEFDRVNLSYRTVYNFDSTQSGGYTNQINLKLGNNGKIYGTSYYGGLYSCGFLFEYDFMANNFQILVNFNGITGAFPNGNIIEFSNGKFYGIAQSGGVSQSGTLYSYDLFSGTLQILYDFDYSQTGYVKGGLTYDNDSLVYLKCIYNISFTTNLICKFYAYNVFTDSMYFSSQFPLNPNSNGTSNLELANDGKFYLTESNLGGPQGGTRIFQFDPINNNFQFKNAINCQNFQNGFSIANNGKFYGITNCEIFNYDIITNNISSTFIIPNNFTQFGKFPIGKLLQANNGKYYGATQKGGLFNQGILFEYDEPSNAFIKLFDFGTNTPLGGAYGSMISDNIASFYGYSTSGGHTNSGYFFKYNYISENFQKLKEFNRNTDGENPFGKPLLASNGNIYGLTNSGGKYGLGTLFKYDTATNIITKIIDFDGSNGANPTGGLTQLNSNLMLGMTSKGGINNKGVIFEFHLNADSIYKVIDFVGSANGANPYDDLVISSTNKIVGITKYGGINDMGVIVEYNPILKSLSKRYDFFSQQDGSKPIGKLIEQTNGKFYGMTAEGGMFSSGVIFEYDYSTNNYSKKVDLNATSGMLPNGSLFLASNGRLYGTATYGGVNNKGTFFEYLAGTNSVNKKFDFVTSFGANPYYSQLIEKPISLGVEDKLATQDQIVFFPNPSSGKMAFNIPLEKGSCFELEIFNSLGVKCSNFQFSTNSICLDLSQLSKGLYIVYIKNEKGDFIKNEKLILN